jgi:hypothetical protein
MCRCAAAAAKQQKTKAADTAGQCSKEAYASATSSSCVWVSSSINAILMTQRPTFEVLLCIAVVTPSGDKMGRTCRRVIAAGYHKSNKAGTVRCRALLSLPCQAVKCASPQSPLLQGAKKGQNQRGRKQSVPRKCHYHPILYAALLRWCTQGAKIGKKQHGDKQPCRAHTILLFLMFMYLLYLLLFLCCVQGAKIGKKQRGDKLEQLLARNDSSKALRTIYDAYNDEDIVLSKEELRMIMRIRKGQFPHVEVGVLVTSCGYAGCCAGCA